MLAGLPLNSLPLVDLPLKHLMRNVLSNIRTEGDVVVSQVGEMQWGKVQVRTSCTTRFGAQALEDWMLKDQRQSRNTVSQPGNMAVFARASDPWHALFTQSNAARSLQ